MSSGETRTTIYAHGRFRTFAGHEFEIFRPRRAEIDIRDIAHSLSLICRWNGHCRTHYSVAQHSVIVAGLTSPEFSFEALMHDAAEAYIGDMMRPMKHRIAGFVYTEMDILSEIFRKYGIKSTPRSGRAVDLADDTVCATEGRDLFDGEKPEGWLNELPAPLAEKITPWPSSKAESRFLQKFLELTPENPDELAAVNEFGNGD